MTYEILEAPPSEFELTQFAKLPAIRGSQFGKDTYSTMIKFKDLDKFLTAFPNVQRSIIPRRVTSLKTYILGGLENKNVRLRFFNAVTCTARGSLFYDDDTHTLVIDTISSKLSINDGQHRAMAINETIKELEKKYTTTKKKHLAEKYRAYIDELNDMTIPVIIFNGLSESEEKGLFHDLNNLAQRPSRNTSLTMSQTDKVAALAYRISQENKYFKHYGVEYEKTGIHKKNKNTFLLTTVYDCLLELYKMEYMAAGKRFVNDDNIDNYFTKSDYTFNSIFYNLPGDMNVKEKYILEKSFVMLAVCRFVQSSGVMGAEYNKTQVYQVLKAMDWSYNLDYWSKYGGSIGISGKMIFPQSSTAVHLIYNALMDKAAEMFK